MFGVVRSFSCGAICLAVFFGLTAASNAQPKQSKPLLMIKVEKERANITQPSNVIEPSDAELKALQEALNKDLKPLFEIVPESDKRDCLELSVVIEKVETGKGYIYAGSSAIAVGKGTTDLLYTHNPIIEPTIQKVSSAVTFQLSTMQVQAILGRF